MTTTAPADAHLARLSEAARMRDEVERRIADLVLAAKADHVPVRSIAAALGVSHGTVVTKYRCQPC